MTTTQNPVSASWTYRPGHGTATPSRGRSDGLYLISRCEDGFTETMGRVTDARWREGRVEVFAGTGENAKWFALGKCPPSEGYGSVRVDYLVVEGDEPVDA